MNVIDTLIEIELPDEDAFLKIKETLTRIGVASKKENVLYQSCHILHKQGRYFILGFKELFALDGKPTNITENDIARRNTIVSLLEEWGLLRVISKEGIKEPRALLNQIKVLSFKEKDNWSLQSKYQIGVK